MPNKVALIVMLIIIGLTALTLYEMQSDIDRLKEKLVPSSASKPTTTKSEPQGISCEEWKEKIDTCLTDAQTCLGRLNTYSSKHEMYETKVQDCQTRNKKNSDRNNELR